jgi:electron transfer flavoprotein beta subunit
MRICACIKEIPNPEMPASNFRVDEQMMEAIPLPGLPFVTSPFDEQAIEAALRIRDSGREVKISLVSFGPLPSVQRALKRGLSMGADDGISISDAGLEGADSYATAHILAAAIRKAGGFDIILAGRQAADWDSGIVGCGIAELLGIPLVTFAKSVRVTGDVVQIGRVLDDSIETVETSMPCVVTISNELGEPRKASLRETMRAAKKPVVAWARDSVGMEDSAFRAHRALLVRKRLFIPVKENRCEFISASSPSETARLLVDKLAAAKLI